MDDLNPDLVLSVFSYLSAKDNARVVQCCRRYLYLVERFRAESFGPELVGASSSSSSSVSGKERRGGGNASPKDVLREALSRVRARPNVAFCFYRTPTARNRFCGDVDPLLEGATVLGVRSRSLQYGDAEKGSECDSEFCCLLGSFPGATFCPFLLPDAPRANESACPYAAAAAAADEDEEEDADDDPYGRCLREALRDARPDDDDDEKDEDYWKVFVVYACGAGPDTAERVLAGLRAAHPRAVVVGGICDGGDLRLPDDPARRRALRERLASRSVRQLRRLIVTEWGHDSLSSLPNAMDKDALVDHALERTLRSSRATTDGRRVSPAVPSLLTEVVNGVYGVAIGGNVPVRSLVSRGVRDLHGGGKDGGTTPDRWRVQDVDYVEPGDAGYPYRGPASFLKPVHIVRSLYDARTDRRNVPPMEFVAPAEHSRMPQYLSARSTSSSSSLAPLRPFSVQDVHHGALYLMNETDDEGRSIREGHVLGLYELDGDECVADLGRALDRLKRDVDRDDEELLGALLFTCSGRGPRLQRGALLTDVPMSDATRFRKTFPTLPLAGFYANGEIGPAATAPRRDDDNNDRGNDAPRRAALQGFTAVLAVFVVPSRRGRPTADLDDHEAKVTEYVRERLSSSSWKEREKEDDATTTTTSSVKRRRGQRERQGTTTTTTIT